MEAIEDIHNIAFSIVVESLKTQESVALVKGKFLNSLSSFMSSSNMNLFSLRATQMLVAAGVAH
jgi:hypothetical protein